MDAVRITCCACQGDYHVPLYAPLEEDRFLLVATTCPYCGHAISVAVSEDAEGIPEVGASDLHGQLCDARVVDDPIPEPRGGVN